MEPHPGKDFIRSHIAGRETHDDIEFRGDGASFWLTGKLGFAVEIGKAF
jgi:hypothetical protein